MASEGEQHRTKIGIIFDDGFAKSSLATAQIFESYGLAAVFAVIADTTNFTPGAGDFGLWNELQSRGHIIHPHGYDHTKLSQVAPEAAVELVRRCLSEFGEKLEGFDAAKALYAFTYNIGTPETIQWLLPRVRAVRVGGNPFLTDDVIRSREWTSTAFGPGDPYEHFLDHLNQCRLRKPASLFYSLHGLDGEYWGATSSDNLRRILDLITAENAFDYWPLT